MMAMDGIEKGEEEENATLEPGGKGKTKIMKGEGGEKSTQRLFIIFSGFFSSREPMPPVFASQRAAGRSTIEPKNPQPSMSRKERSRE